MKKVILKILRDSIIFLIISTIFISLNIYFDTIPAKTLGTIIDYLPKSNVYEDEIIKNIYVLIFASLLCMVCRLVWKMCVQVISRSAEKTMKDEIFKQFLRLKLDSIQNIKNGELMSYLTKDIAEIRSFIYRLSNQIVRAVAIFIIAITRMKEVNSKLTVTVLIPLLLSIVITFFIKNKISKSFKEAQTKFTAMSEFVQESTDSIRTTKAYSIEDSQSKTFVRKNNSVRLANQTVDYYQALFYTSIDICFGLCIGISVIYGSSLVLSHQISVGDLVAFTGYLALFEKPMIWIPAIVSKAKRARISYARLDKLYSLEVEPISDDASSDANTIKGDIVIKNLTFNYPEYTDEVLKNVSLRIPQGSTLGIIGTIGSGKTTLTNLLLRLYDFENNKIFIDGKDIKSLDLEDLRKSFCYITQDNFLFSNTIKNNITLFKDEYREEDVIDSVDKAMFKSDLDSMKDGIETIIGDKGIDLSGGQKQRVVISRAFLNRSNFIIFDDTFSALDNKTEKELLKNIKELTENKTCIIISNRISDIKDADNIIVLDDGVIVEEGKHNDLVNKEGLYRNFYLQQSSKF